MYKSGNCPLTRKARAKIKKKTETMEQTTY
jgi:hypothetical protein